MEGVLSICSIGTVVAPPATTGTMAVLAGCESTLLETDCAAGAKALDGVGIFNKGAAFGGSFFGAVAAELESAAFVSVEPGVGNRPGVGSNGFLPVVSNVSFACLE